jgi:hypothetical protein
MIDPKAESNKTRPKEEEKAERKGRKKSPKELGASGK